MPYRICKVFEVENGHLLSKHPSDCKFPHGHTRRIELVLEADTLDEREMVCDFKAVKDAVGAYIHSLDHALCVNTLDPNYAMLKNAFGERIIDFEGIDPTTEMVAKTIFDRLTSAMAEYARREDGPYSVRPNVRVRSVRVWETSTCWAECSAD